MTAAQRRVVKARPKLQMHPADGQAISVEIVRYEKRVILVFDDLHIDDLHIDDLRNYSGLNQYFPRNALFLPPKGEGIARFALENGWPE